MQQKKTIRNAHFSYSSDIISITLFKTNDNQGKIRDTMI